MNEVANTNACERISRFVDTCSSLPSSPSPQALAFGIECALETFEHESNKQRVNLVWTGPVTTTISVRRSAAVLLELIDDSRTDLIVISFASFRIPDVEVALSAAVTRGVQLYLILESEEESSGRYHQYGGPAYAALLRSANVRYYSWPKNRRPSGALLHAKAVICDANKALITSANLTERAIDDNIELGILIEGGRVPEKLHSHVMSLIQSGDFEAAAIL